MERPRIQAVATRWLSVASDPSGSDEVAPDLSSADEVDRRGDGGAPRRRAPKAEEMAPDVPDLSDGDEVAPVPSGDDEVGEEDDWSLSGLSWEKNHRKERKSDSTPVMAHWRLADDGEDGSGRTRLVPNPNTMALIPC